MSTIWLFLAFYQKFQEKAQNVSDMVKCAGSMTKSKSFVMEVNEIIMILFIV